MRPAPTCARRGFVARGAIAVALLVGAPSARAKEAGTGASDEGANSSERAKSSERATPDEAYARYAAFARRHGMAPSRDRALVIGIRGRDLRGELHDTRIVAAYDDTLVVLTPDRRVVTLPVSTHPWERAGPGVPDVNGDGAPDVGMIRPGKYVAVRRDPRRDIGGAPTFHVLTVAGRGKLPGWRNTDQDDTFSATERERSEARGDALTAVLFHRSGPGTPSPVGCQVLDAEGMQRLASEVGAKFDYLLVDANEVAVP